MDNIINPAIVVVAYNREKCICRLLKALENAKYDVEVTLIISVDYGDNQNVIDIANGFFWSHGKKIVRTFTENQGCKRHVIKCIDYSIEYGAAIIFEDDILPSMNFYSYVTKSLQFYSKYENIFAIALHNQIWNGFADEIFLPVRNGYDVYIAKRVCSWGECFVGSKWKAFKDWYGMKKELTNRDDAPRVIYDWNDSWGKYVWDYILEENLYFVIPYDSHTTRFNDVGVHIKDNEIKYKCQVPLAGGKETYIFPNFEEAVKYDAFFESIDLKQHIERKYGKKTVIDYYGTRENYGDAQLCLTRKVLPYKILETYGDDMLQPELNYFYNIKGDDIILYDLEKSAEKIQKIENKNSIYFGDELKLTKEIADKHLFIMEVFCKWMKIIQHGKSISEYLQKNSISNVAVYGVGMLGERLLDELCASGISVVCGIDRDLRKHHGDIPIKALNNIPDIVEYIIVTAVYYYSDIKIELQKETDAEIISIYEILEKLDEDNLDI